MRVIDISDPLSPTLKATCPSDYALGVAVSGSCAYLADGNAGLLVIDLLP
jgi:hypothetical protein